MAIAIKPINPAPADASPPTAPPTAQPPNPEPAWKKLKRYHTSADDDGEATGAAAGAMADFSTMFAQPMFTFIIGYEKKEYQVHGGMIGKHSTVLDTMMNNGAMKESLTHTCSLPLVEPGVFDLFLQWVYRGWYWTGKPVSLMLDTAAYEEVIEALIEKGSTVYWCTSCGCKCSVKEMTRAFPYCNSLDLSRQSCKNKYQGAANKCPLCSRKFDDQTGTKKTFNHICEACCHNYNICPGLPQPVIYEQWGRFMKPLFRGQNAEYGPLEAYVAAVLPEDEPSDDLLSHVNLFIFADTYDIKPLQELCLFKLHRDLQYHRLDNAKVIELVDLIIEETRQMPDHYRKQMEDLLISFCACYIVKLIDDDEFFEAMLCSNDVYRGIIRRLAS